MSPADLFTLATTVAWALFFHRYAAPTLFPTTTEEPQA